MIRRIRFTRIATAANQIAAQLQGLHFSAFHPPAVKWEPAVNVYAFKDRLEVCVDLSGVPKQDIHIDVEPRRLAIRGHRSSPDSGCGHPPCGRVLVMEIPDGNFERILGFPMDVDTAQVEARQEDGWVWISLPLAEDSNPGS